MKIKTVKLLAGVIVGMNPPKHLLVAYGRHIFRLFHISGYASKTKCNLYIRDLPMSIMDLAHDYNRHEAWNAYVSECDRVGVPANERIGA